MRDAAVAMVSWMRAGRRLPGAMWMLLSLCAALALVEPAFASPSNVRNVLLQASLLMLLALPMTLIVLTEGLDLSMGASLSLATIVLALVDLSPSSAVTAVAAAMAVAAAIGVLNGVLIAACELPPFVGTLGTLGIAQGLALVLAEGRSTMGVSEAVLALCDMQVASVPVPIAVALAVWGALHLLLYHTRFGPRVFALGGNREALRFAGIPVRTSLVIVYTVGGLCVGIAALLMTSRLSGGHTAAGAGMEFEAIAAVAVGGTALRRGQGWLAGTVLGVLVVTVLRNGLNLLGLPSSLQVAAVGAVVIAALWLDQTRSRR